MADLEFTVAMIGQAQAEKGLDTLAKKSDQVAKSEKIREKATEAANKATTKTAIPTFGQAGASSKYDPFKSAKYQTQQAEKAARETVLQQRAVEVAQAAKIKSEEKLQSAAEAASEAARAARVKAREKARAAEAKAAALASAPDTRLGRLGVKIGGAAARVSGMGDAAASGIGLGGLGAIAVVAAVGLRVMAGALAVSSQKILERAAAEVKAANIADSASKAISASGVKALEAQGSNLLRLESIGPAFTKMAKELAAPGKGRSFDVTDTQTAVLEASKGGVGFTDTRKTVEAAGRLAVLTGKSLTESVKAIQETNGAGVSSSQAVASALSISEDRRVTLDELSRREMYLRESSLAGDIQSGRKLKSQIGLAEQGNIGASSRLLVRQLLDVINPAMGMHADAYRENSIKLDALTKAIESQDWKQQIIDGFKYVAGNDSLRGQRDSTSMEMGALGDLNNTSGPLPVIGN